MTTDVISKVTSEGNYVEEDIVPMKGRQFQKHEQLSSTQHGFSNFAGAGGAGTAPQALYDAQGRRINMEKATPTTNNALVTSTGTNFRPNKMGQQHQQRMSDPSVKLEPKDGKILAGSAPTVGEFFSLGAAQLAANALPGRYGLKASAHGHEGEHDSSRRRADGQSRQLTKESFVSTATGGGSSSSTATAGFYGPSSGPKDKNAAANGNATGAQNRRQKGTYTYDV